MGEDWLQDETSVKSISQASTPTPSSTNSASAGALIWDWTIGSQHSSSAGSLVPSARAPLTGGLSKHSSFEFDDSLGILTPDQMADFSHLPRTPSTEDVHFPLQDLDPDPQRRGSKRSSMEMQDDEASAPKSAQNNLFNCVALVKIDNILEEKQYSNEIVMKEPVAEEEGSKTLIDGINEIMDQEIAKDFSEDTEMSESNPSKKTSARSISYEPGSETMSNSDNLDHVRINRTPSLEDLPMDKTGQLTGPSKDVLPPPTSFVTSVTSIASLDNGYQGDGEWSRPASRGADHSPLASKVKAPISMDPMTDSDFFTESDADMHEDAGAGGSGTGRGDRKAQVIDGTLYGGVSGSAQQPPVPPNHRCPTFTPTTEEMDSSGIYSDLERKTEDFNSEGKSLPDSIGDANENEKDLSPEGSTRTGSSIRSDLSQTMISPAAFTNLLMQQMDTIRSLVNGTVESDDTTDITDVLSEKTVVEVKDSGKKREDHLAKKYKMPKRNVVSKIKTMITSPSIKKEVEDENQENRRPQRTQRKNGRWDAVMNKIAQGKEEEKSKPRLKEVKSRVFAGISVTPSAKEVQPPVTQSRTPTGRGLVGSQSASTRSLRDVSSLKSKSRRSRTRGSECSLPAGAGKSQASSRNSSLSDVSLKASPLPPPQTIRTSKKNQQQQQQRDGVRSASPQSDGSVAGGGRTNQSLPSRLLANRPAVRTLQRIVESSSKPTVFEPESSVRAAATRPYSLRRHLHIEKNGAAVVDLKASPVRKPAQRRSVTAPAKTVPLRDLNRVEPVSGNGVPVAAPVPVVVVAGVGPVTRQPSAPQTVRLEVASRQLRHAAQGVEALGVLLNYLVHNLDAFSTPQLKQDLDRMREDWLNTKMQMEEVQVSYNRCEEQKNICERRLQETQEELVAQKNSHREQLLSVTKSHEQEVNELQHRVTSQVEEMSRAHATEMERLRVEAEQEAMAAKEREAELSERVSVAQKDYEAIKDQSRSLLDSMYSDRDSKLQATVSRCKMLQEEVASLRAVLELRSKDLQELRRSSELAHRDAGQLPAAMQRIGTLTARVQDLEIQLERKTANEQALAAEKEMIELKVQHEDNKNKRLSQYNEELMWKLKHSSEVVSALAALNHEINISKSVQIISPQSNATTPKHCHAESHKRNGMTSTTKIQSPPVSPTPMVKGVVEKSDSVSWVVDLDDAPQNVATRLVRRAHSMRTVQSSTPSPAHHSHARTLPHKRQRSRTTPTITHTHARTRSFSFDSDSSEPAVPRKLVAEWDDAFSTSPGRDSTSPQSQPDTEGEDLIVVETVGEDRLSFLDLERHIDREKIEVMGGEDFASPKLSSSSGGSEVSIRSRKNDPKTIEKEEILMINRVDGLISSLPKESAGEAMISEETSDNDSGARDSDEEVERYGSDDDSLSGSASELVERRRKFLVEHKIKIDLKHQNLMVKKVSELFPGSDSGSLSAATTAMDLSWSEDIDLLPSESEG